MGIYYITFLISLTFHADYVWVKFYASLFARIKMNRLNNEQCDERILGGDFNENYW